ncbi:MAG: NADH-quinone oxidoreductase subunit J [Rhodobacteraceae bacterium]|nr:NADH-quinone oxidoreductase subunit J [Paracoccaceae bacterium]
MVIEALVFYVFAAIAVLCGVMVISARNPVHSVLYLILAFFNAAGLFVLQGAEFLAMLLVIVYVGAVAVLFLFVVMMLDVDFVKLREGFLQYLPFAGLVGLIVLVELLMAVGGWIIDPTLISHGSEPIPALSDTSNIEAIGSVLYTKYIFFFQVAGLVLLVAMIGAIVLTLRHREGVRRQNISQQVGRTREGAVEIRKVESGKGI